MGKDWGKVGTHHAAPTTERPMQRPMPRSAHCSLVSVAGRGGWSGRLTAYGDTLSRNCPTCATFQMPLLPIVYDNIPLTLKASPSPVNSRSVAYQRWLVHMLVALIQSPTTPKAAVPPPAAYDRLMMPPSSRYVKNEIEQKILVDRRID